MLPLSFLFKRQAHVLVMLLSRLCSDICRLEREELTISLSLSCLSCLLYPNWWQQQTAFSTHTLTHTMHPAVITNRAREWSSLEKGTPLNPRSTCRRLHCCIGTFLSAVTFYQNFKFWLKLNHKTTRQMCTKNVQQIRWLQVCCYSNPLHTAPLNLDIR